MRRKQHVLLTWFIVVLMAPTVANARPQPDLYPNAYLQKVGQVRANQDVNRCHVKADDYLGDTATQRKQQNRQDTVRRGARGAAMGALAGAITGENVGRATGAGAAIGAASSVLDNRRETRENELHGSPEYRNYMSACLEDLGYKVVGWR